MYRQTEDNRLGMLEGVITCFVAEYLDAEDFWYVIDSHIYADHENVLDFIESVTRGEDFNQFGWLEADQSNELITACPTLKEHLKRKGFNV